MIWEAGCDLLNRFLFFGTRRAGYERKLHEENCYISNQQLVSFEKTMGNLRGSYTVLRHFCCYRFWISPSLSLSLSFKHKINTSNHFPTQAKACWNSNTTSLALSYPTIFKMVSWEFTPHRMAKGCLPSLLSALHTWSNNLSCLSCNDYVC